MYKFGQNRLIRYPEPMYKQKYPRKLRFDAEIKVEENMKRDSQPELLINTNLKMAVTKENVKKWLNWIITIATAVTVLIDKVFTSVPN